MRLQQDLRPILTAKLRRASRSQAGAAFPPGDVPERHDIPLELPTIDAR
jgi:hypothetical protein